MGTITTNVWSSEAALNVSAQDSRDKIITSAESRRCCYDGIELLKACLNYCDVRLISTRHRAIWSCFKNAPELIFGVFGSRNQSWFPSRLPTSSHSASYMWLRTL